MRHLHRFSRATLTTALLSIATVAILVATAFVILFGRVLAPPPFTYVDTDGRYSPARLTTYQPEIAALCPGDTLRWRVGFDVIEAPVTIGNTVAIRNRATDRVVRGTLGSLNPPVPYGEPAQLRGVPVSYPLPATITPGDYLFVFVASAEGYQSNGFHVPFSVRADCEAER